MDYSFCKFIGIWPLSMSFQNDCAYPLAYPLSDKIEDRNTVMVDVLTKSPTRDTVGIVGAAHLYGMIKETNLTQKYYVLPVSTINVNLFSRLSSSAEHQYLSSKDVTQAFIKDTETWTNYFLSIPDLLERLRVVSARESQ